MSEKLLDELPIKELEYIKEYYELRVIEIDGIIKNRVLRIQKNNKEKIVALHPTEDVLPPNVED